jgi:predicted RNA-binding protein with PUA-like domain
MAKRAQPLPAWLMKSEPSCFSIQDLQRRGTEPWSGVRNYEARNAMRAMQPGEIAFIYHSNAEPSGVAGLAEIVRAAYPDHTAWDPADEHYDPASTPAKPRWWMVDVRFVAAFPRLVPLSELRAVPELADLALFTRSRLSVIPVGAQHARIILGLAGR